MSAEGSGLVPGDHPDRIRWNAKYGAGFVPSFTPHPLAARALALSLPDGPVADLACGPPAASWPAARVVPEAGRTRVPPAAGLQRARPERGAGPRPPPATSPPPFGYPMDVTLLACWYREAVRVRSRPFSNPGTTRAEVV